MARIVGCAFGWRAALQSVPRLAASAATAAPPSFFGASVLPALREQCLARSDVSFDEIRPPRTDRLVEFARFAAQQEEIIPRSKSLVFQQLQRTSSGAFFEAQLQATDLAHIRREALVDREFLRLHVEDVVHRAMQCGYRIFAVRFKFL